MTHKQPSSEGRGIWKHYFDESGHKVIRVIPGLDHIIQEQRPLNADSPHHIFCDGVALTYDTSTAPINLYFT